MLMVVVRLKLEVVVLLRRRAIVRREEEEEGGRSGGSWGWSERTVSRRKR